MDNIIDINFLRINVAIYTAFVQEDLLMDDIIVQEKDCESYIKENTRWISKRQYCDNNIEGNVENVKREQMSLFLKDSNEYDLLLISHVNVLGKTLRESINLINILKEKKIILFCVRGPAYIIQDSGDFLINQNCIVVDYANTCLKRLFYLSTGKRDNEYYPWDTFRGSFKTKESLLKFLESEEIQNDKWIQIVQLSGSKSIYKHKVMDGNNLKTILPQIISSDELNVFFMEDYII
jgi:hypothetical protein